MSKLTPPYIPVDTKELIVPEGEPDPAGFARRYFMAEYGLARQPMRYLERRHSGCSYANVNELKEN